MSTVLLAGFHVPKEFSGQVFSLHDHVLNIRDSDAHRLISIIDRPEDLTGLSLLVDRLPVNIVQGWGVVAAGSTVVISGSGGGSAHVPVLWPPTAARFTGALSPPGNNWAEHDISGLVEACRAALSASGGDAASGLNAGFLCLGLGDQPANIHAKRASSLLDAGRAEELGARLSLLVGLGIGFTPSGDDFICGALAASAVFGAVSGRPGVRLDTVLSRLESTTAGGASLLWLACRGSFPAYLVRFVNAVLRTKVGSTHLDRAVRAAVGHGATSGADAVAGFIWMLSELDATAPG